MFWTSVWMCKVTALFSNYQIFHSENYFFPWSTNYELVYPWRNICIRNRYFGNGGFENNIKKEAIKNEVLRKTKRNKRISISDTRGCRWRTCKIVWYLIPRLWILIIRMYLLDCKDVSFWVQEYIFWSTSIYLLEYKQVSFGVQAYIFRGSRKYLLERCY